MNRCYQLTVQRRALCENNAAFRSAKVGWNVSFAERKTTLNRRDGAVLLAVLVCLGIASAITGVAIHRSLSARRQLTHDWQLEQTRMLLDAGIRRAHRSAAEQSDYAGESWILDGALKSYPTARVEIHAADNNEMNADRAKIESEEPAVVAKQFKITATIQNRDVNPFQTKRSRVVSVRAAKNATTADVSNVTVSTDDNASG